MRPIRISLILMLLAVTFADPLAAQHGHRDSPQAADSSRMDGMMSGGMMGMMQMHMQMMQRMMNDPIRRSAMLAHVVPALQEPLGLSSDQVSRLEQIRDRFKEQSKNQREQLQKARGQLQEAMQDEQARPEQVRSLLEEVAIHQARMQALGYEAAAEMKASLTPDQQEQLSTMKPMQLHHHMMDNLTMMEMMQVMHGGAMMGAGGTMSGGMTMEPDGMMRRADDMPRHGHSH